MNTRKTDLEDKRAKALRANLKRRKQARRAQDEAPTKAQADTGADQDTGQETHDDE